jgi:hypothetical protein
MICPRPASISLIQLPRKAAARHRIGENFHLPVLGYKKVDLPNMIGESPKFPWMVVYTSYMYPEQGLLA